MGVVGVEAGRTVPRRLLHLPGMALGHPLLAQDRVGDGSPGVVLRTEVRVRLVLHLGLQFTRNLTDVYTATLPPPGGLTLEQGSGDLARNPRLPAVSTRSRIYMTRIHIPQPGEPDYNRRWSVAYCVRCESQLNPRTFDCFNCKQPFTGSVEIRKPS